MNARDILKMTDHTLLKVGCTEEDIKNLCDEAIKYECASVCVPPCYVGFAKDYIAGRGGVKVCTVVGFPNGYSTATAKTLEAVEAKVSGADEIDMVINVCFVKDRKWGEIEAEIGMVRNATKGLIMKVIIETCLLTDEEKVKLCKIISEYKCDYVKTSTGFSTGGATVMDVNLLGNCIGSHVKIKASGGIHNFNEAEAMIMAGADRIGASSLVAEAKKEGV